FADVRDQHAATGRFRDVEAIAPGAADRDIGAGRPRAGLDARYAFAVRREHEDMAERRMRDEQPPCAVHGHAVGPARTEQRAEAADLGHAAVLHEGKSPHRIVARHGDEEHGLLGIEHETVRADAGIDQAIEPAIWREAIDAAGRI